jgi:F-type H+-transporting ATPase subunit b
MHAKAMLFAVTLTIVSAIASPALSAEDGHDLGHGNASSSLESPAAFSKDLAIYTFIVFLAVLAILSKAAWPTISNALVEREERINATIAAAEAKHEEAKQLLAQHEAKLASAADEVRAIVEEGRRDAEATKEQIVAEAREAAEQERRRAVRDIEIAADHAMQRLAERSAEAAISLAGKVLRETITSQKQSELVREAIGFLSAPSDN